MSQRFQFSMKAVLALMAAVAVACALWMKVPTAVRWAIGIGAAGCLLGAFAFGWLPPGIPDWIVGASKSRPRHVVRWKRRRRGDGDGSEK